LKTRRTASASIWLIPPSASGALSSCTGLGKENCFQVLLKSADGTDLFGDSSTIPQLLDAFEKLLGQAAEVSCNLRCLDCVM